MARDQAKELRTIVESAAQHSDLNVTSTDLQMSMAKATYEVQDNCIKGLPNNLFVTNPELFSDYLGAFMNASSRGSAFNCKMLKTHVALARAVEVVVRGLPEDVQDVRNLLLFWLTFHPKCLGRTKREVSFFLDGIRKSATSSLSFLIQNGELTLLERVRSCFQERELTEGVLLQALANDTQEGAYKVGDNGRISSGLFWDGLREQSFNVTWELTGRTTSIRRSTWSRQCKWIAKAPDIKVGVLLQQLQNRTVNCTQVSRAGDVARVATDVWWDKSGKQRFKVFWERTHSMTRIAVSAWPRRFKFVSEAPLMVVGTKVQALSSWADSSGTPYHKLGDTGRVSFAEYEDSDGDRVFDVLWDSTSKSTAEYVDGWPEQVKFLEEAPVLTVGTKMQALSDREGCDDLACINVGDLCHVSRTVYQNSQDISVFDVVWENAGKTTTEFFNGWPQQMRLLEVPPEASMERRVPVAGTQVSMPSARRLQDGRDATASSDRYAACSAGHVVAHLAAQSQDVLQANADMIDSLFSTYANGSGGDCIAEAIAVIAEHAPRLLLNHSDALFNSMRTYGENSRDNSSQQAGTATFASEAAKSIATRHADFILRRPQLVDILLNLQRNASKRDKVASNAADAAAILFEEDSRRGPKSELCFECFRSPAFAKLIQEQQISNNLQARVFASKVESQRENEAARQREDRLTEASMFRRRIFDQVGSMVSFQGSDMQAPSGTMLLRTRSRARGQWAEAYKCANPTVCRGLRTLPQNPDIWACADDRYRYKKYPGVASSGLVLGFWESSGTNFSFSRLDDATAMCDELGSECAAVTCSRHGWCTLRREWILTSSSTGETTYKKVCPVALKRYQCDLAYNDTSPGCAECTEGHGRNQFDPHMCKPCGKRWTQRIAFILEPAIMFFVSLFSAHAARQGVKNHSQSGVLKIALSFSTSANILFNALQTANDFNIAADEIGAWLGISIWAAESGAVLYSGSYDCLLEQTMAPLGAWTMLSACMPACLLLLLVALHTVSRIARSANCTKLADKISFDLVQGSLVWGNLFLPGLAGACMRYLPCVHLQDELKGQKIVQYMAYSPSAECHSQLSALLPASLLLLALAGPVYWVFLMNKWSSEDRESTLGFLQGTYKDAVKQWEVVVLCRRGALSMIAAFFPVSYAPASHVLAALIILVLAWVMHMWWRPFEHEFLNHLEGGLLGVTVLSSICSVYVMADEWSATRRSRLATLAVGLGALSLSGILLMGLLAALIMETLWRRMFNEQSHSD